MTVSHKKRVCVIGAGVSGLCSIKSCLEENLDVVCYEKSNDIGGLWNYNRTVVGENHATVMESTIVNTSKEMFAYSDFPPPAEWPNWMHHSLVCKYLKMYAEYFGLMYYIQLNTGVEKVVKANDYTSSGKWVVHTSDGKLDTFDCIMLCTGHFADPYIPPKIGIDNFKGSVYHSQMYKNWKGFENKKVLLIGISNSSLDIACELANFSKQVYISTRRGAWILSRLSLRGYSSDVKFLTRFLAHVQSVLPNSIQNTYAEYLANLRLDHDMYCLKPKHRFLEQHSIISDSLPMCLASGSVKIKGDVKTICTGSVIFEDDTEAEIDTIIFCTGYTFGFPFLDPDIIPIEDNNVNLYKFVFPPDLLHSTLAVIGLVVPLGALGPVSEMQSRWVAQILNKKLSLPSKDEMKVDIQNVRLENEKNFYKSLRHTLKIPFVPYLNTLAEFIGAKPNLFKLLVTDPHLFYSCYFGPCTSYSYRLNGPNAWPDARRIILDTKNRIKQPLQTRKVEVTDKSENKKWLWSVLIGFCLMLFITVLYYN